MRVSLFQDHRAMDGQVHWRGRTGFRNLRRCCTDHGRILFL